MHSLVACAEFIDSISQEIGFRPPEFMPEFAEPVHSLDALCLHLERQLVEPVQKRYRLVFWLPEEIDFCLRQPSSPSSQYCELLSKATILRLGLAIAPATKAEPLRRAVGWKRDFRLRPAWRPRRWSVRNRSARKSHLFMADSRPSLLRRNTGPCFSKMPRKNRIGFFAGGDSFRVSVPSSFQSAADWGTAEGHARTSSFVERAE